MTALEEADKLQREDPGVIVRIRKAMLEEKAVVDKLRTMISKEMISLDLLINEVEKTLKEYDIEAKYPFKISS